MVGYVLMCGHTNSDAKWPVEIFFTCEGAQAEKISREGSENYPNCEFWVHKVRLGADFPDSLG